MEGAFEQLHSREHSTTLRPSRFWNAEALAAPVYHGTEPSTRRRTLWATTGHGSPTDLRGGQARGLASTR